MSTYLSSNPLNNYTTGNTELVFYTNVPSPRNRRPTCGVDCVCVKHAKKASEKAVPGYDYIKFLAQGVFSAVHLYRNRSSRKTVAIKSMPYYRNGQCTFMEVASEYEIVMNIVHPNILRYYDFFTNTQLRICFLVMEYASRGSLRQLLKEQRIKNKLFASRVVLKMLRDIITGVEFLNSKHVLHCDLKPDNILLGDDALLKISDFGTAHFKYDINVNDGHTTAYIAPEQFSGVKPNEKTEIWAIGIIAYEMCKLEHPYGFALTTAQLEHKVRNGGFTPLHPQYGNDLQNLVEILLQSKPERRGTLSSILRNKIFNF